ncbi:MAG: cobalamin B12-binding domain-containing protein [Gallintestinimicrobium sp.]
MELAEYTINQTVEEILADLYERKPEAVAFSCYIWNWKMMQEVISELHQVRPELPIWLGGPEVSYHAERFWSNSVFDRHHGRRGRVTFSEL